MNGLTPKTWAIAASASVSTAAVDCESGTLAGLICPATLDATSARVIFTVSMDNSTFYPLYGQTGTRVQATITNARADAVVLDVNEFAAWRYIKITVTTSDASTAVAQTSAETFTALIRNV